MLESLYHGGCLCWSVSFRRLKTASTFISHNRKVEKLYNVAMVKEVYICVDVETAGPFPGQFAMLSIGACLVENLQATFYAELQPDRPDFLPEALGISGLSLELLKDHGSPPQDVMRDFAEWIKAVAGGEVRVVFVALNAPFDWMFVNDYFYRYLGQNPFGHSALDIKAYYMGLTGVSWSETSMKHISAAILEEKHLVHNALRDAQDQAEIFRKLLERAERND
jgi:DNA polymerase III epsilon subunit-like protein